MTTKAAACGGGLFQWGARLIISEAHRSVLVPHDKAAALWPNAPTLLHNGGRYAILPHTPQTQIRLRAVELEAPAPILSYYDWPSSDGLRPFAIQKTTAALMTSHQRAFVLNDMGTGKTRSAIWAWHYLHSIGAANKLLIVAPLSTLKFVWWREITLMFPRLKVAVLHGSKQKRLDLLAQDHDVYIINHDGLGTILNQVHERTDIDTLVLDELTVYRGPSLRAKQMWMFAARFVWAWGMTGRPIPNSPLDCWGQCKVLVPGNVPKWRRQAQFALLRQVSDFLWVPKPDAIETVHRWMQPAVRFTLDDVVELPEAIYRTVQVELSPEQKRIYQQVSNDYVALVKEKKITAANAGVAVNKLLQIGSGYVYTTNPEYVALDSTPRHKVLLDMIEQATDKLIVCAPWTHLINNLSTLLTAEKIPHALVHGGTTRREEIFNDFENTDRYRVLLVHPEVCHHGLTLVAATTVVWYSPITSLEIFEQLNARIRRIGQTRKQQFLQLQATPVERRVYALLRDKKRLQNELLALLETATTE